MADRSSNTLDTLSIDSDPVSRRGKLDELIDNLTHDEIRHVRNRLNTFTFNHDVCANLPVEILLQVAQYVDLEDVLRFRSVSRSWHEAFSNFDFCSGLIKNHLPWVLPQPIYQKSESMVDRATLLSIYQDAILKRVRRKTGCYTSRRLYRYNGFKDNRIDEISQPQYYNGKVAYQVKPYEIVAKCLRTNTASKYLEPHRERIDNWCLSDEYLVVASRTNLYAYCLTNSDTTFAATLPGAATIIRGIGQTFGIVAQKNVLYLWKVGGSLSALHLPVTGDDHIDSMNSITNVAFPTSHTGFCVSRLFRDGVFTSTAPEHIALDVYSDEESFTSYTVTIPFKNGYVNCSHPDVTGNTLSWKLNPRRDHDGNVTPKGGSSYHISFDMFEKTFRFLAFRDPSYDMPHVSEDIMKDQGFLWRDQMVFLLNQPCRCPGDVLRQIYLGRALAVAVDASPQDEIDERVFAIQERGSPTILDTFLPSRPVISWTCVADQQLLIDIKRSFLWQPSNDNVIDANFWAALPKRMIQGDDDFMVLLGSRDGLVVWCFDKKISLPIPRDYFAL